MTEETDVYEQGLADAAVMPREQLLRHLYAQSVVAAGQRDHLSKELANLRRADKEMGERIGSLERLIGRASAWGGGAMAVGGAFMGLGLALIYARDQVASAAHWLAAVLGEHGGAK